MVREAGPDQPDVVFKERDGWLIATLTRPSKANALTADMMNAMRRSIQTLDAHGLIIRGGCPNFSGGVDLEEARRSTTEASAADALTELVVTIKESPKPIAAVIEGACVGGAVELVGSCDLRVGTRKATFRVPATEIGVVYRPEGYSSLLASLGAAGARRLVLLGQSLDCQDALQAGLLDDVDGDAMARAVMLLSPLVGPSSSFPSQKSAFNLLQAEAGPSKESLMEIQRIRDAHRTGKDGP